MPRAVLQRIQRSSLDNEGLTVLEGVGGPLQILAEHRRLAGRAYLGRVIHHWARRCRRYIVDIRLDYSRLGEGGGVLRKNVFMCTAKEK